MDKKKRQTDRMIGDCVNEQLLQLNHVLNEITVIDELEIERLMEALQEIVTINQSFSLVTAFEKHVMTKNIAQKALKDRE